MSADPERLANLHEWYGLGVLYGISGETPAREGLRWICGRRAAQDQYGRGIRDGRALQSDELAELRG